MIRNPFDPTDVYDPSTLNENYDPQSAAMEQGGITGRSSLADLLAQFQNTGAAPAARASYQPMAGWDQGKLNNGPNNTKYNFGRFVQDQGYDPTWGRTHINDIVGAYNQQYGGNARALKDDMIDFGEGYGPVDVLNGSNYWQWGAWSDPNAPQASPAAAAGTPIDGGPMQSGQTPQNTPTWNAMIASGSAYKPNGAIGGIPGQPRNLLSLFGKV